MAFRSLAADDIFISYSRADATTYANGLANELTKKGFTCFTDRLGTEANEGLPPMLLEKVRNCSMLVVLCTPGARKSPFVGQEIAEFAKNGGATRRVVPVCFDGEAAEASWYKLIVGIAAEFESASALQTGDPAPATVSRIEKAFNYSRSKERLRRYTVAAGILLAALILASIAAAVFAGIQLKQANKAKAEANGANAEASRARTQTEEQTKLAARAGKRARKADLLRVTAEQATKAAQGQQQAAEAAALAAQGRAKAAKAEADRQQAIALSLQLANDAEARRRVA